MMRLELFNLRRFLIVFGDQNGVFATNYKQVAPTALRN
jgi:hypothetical protein